MLLGFVSDTACTQPTRSYDTVGSKLTLVRLGTFIATTVLCLLNNGQGSVGGYRENVCQKNLFLFSCWR